MRKKANKTTFIYFTLREKEFKPLLLDILKRLNKTYKDKNSVLTLFFKYIIDDKSIIYSFIKDFKYHMSVVSGNYKEEEVKNILVKHYIHKNKPKSLHPLVMYNFPRKLKTTTKYIGSENYYPIKIEDNIKILVDNLKNFLDYQNPRGFIIGYFARWGLLNEELLDNFIDFCKKYEIFIYNKS